MRKSQAGTAVAVLVILVLGYWLGRAQTARANIVTARCMTTVVGDGTCFVGDDAYGIPTGVSWTDAQGALHHRGAPACLPPLTSVEQLRVAVQILSVEDWGEYQVAWIDCRGEPALTPGPTLPPGLSPLPG